MLLVTSPYKTTVYCKPETSVYHAHKFMHDKSMQSKSLEIEAERHNIYLWKMEYLNCVKMTLRRVLLLLICPYFEELTIRGVLSLLIITIVFQLGTVIPYCQYSQKFFLGFLCLVRMSNYLDFTFSYSYFIFLSVFPA